MNGSVRIFLLNFFYVNKAQAKRTAAGAALQADSNPTPVVVAAQSRSNSSKVQCVYCIVQNDVTFVSSALF